MDNQRYRVVLTGHLAPGFSASSALNSLAGLIDTSAAGLQVRFDGTERPLDQLLSAEAALELQEQLGRIGVLTRVERARGSASDARLHAGAQNPIESPRSSSFTEAGMMHCPACGHRQMVANRCESCGIVFSEYHRDSAAAMQAQAQKPPSPKVPAEPAVTGSAAAASSSTGRDPWRDDWLDSEESQPDEQYYLALFYGPPAEHYLNACQRYLSGPRTRFGLSWNWAAFFSPFVWSLYRKMWGWSLILFFTEVFAPVLLIVMGAYDIVSSQLVHLGYVLIALNRLVWPALANFLYCSHARKVLQRMHSMAPNYAAEIDIATAGGVSTGAVLVGLAVAGVIGMLLWSLVDSINEPKQVFYIPEQNTVSSTGLAEGNGFNRGADASSTQGQAPENKWVATRRVLQTLGQKADAFLVENPDAEPTQLSIFRLREEFGLPPELLQDAWGAEIQFIPNNQGYRVISSGPDRLFGTVDDLLYQRELENTRP